jgi:PTS system nitrogen regulatory IIA component
MKLADFIDSGAISADLTSTSKMDVLAELGELLARICPEESAKDIAGILVDRERLATTGVGEGIAIPHGKSASLATIRGAVGISRTGISFDAVDGQPVHVFVALLAPLASTGDHLKALARISRILKEPTLRARLLEAASAAEVHRTLIEADAEC